MINYKKNTIKNIFLFPWPKNQKKWMKNVKNQITTTLCNVTLYHSNGVFSPILLSAIRFCYFCKLPKMQITGQKKRGRQTWKNTVFSVGKKQE